ncbi:rhodanese-like domain-containing protein [Ammoniphilus sp. YIM 78166]|uniref:rhodanese-like domain-containing protein n=1 Tax=Ammoniphilus sp. YIM 78166 TaxID=1644106 RepID=UPI0010705266|nr:rhodanese-like domain-containing protein [Ammoniphilus sp. YIM 78166]
MKVSDTFNVLHSHGKHHHGHHHHDHHGHGHHHDHDHGDEYQNEFDIYPIELIERLSLEDFSSKILDIREEWEWEQIYIEGSYCLPMKTLTKDIDKLDPEQPWYVLCTQGIRSSFAAMYLVSQGFKEVYNIQTGIYGVYEAMKGDQPEWLKVKPGWDLNLNK